MKKYIYLGVLFIGALFIFSYPFFIKIKTSCKTQYGDCPKEIKEITQKSDGMSLVSARSLLKKEIKKNVLVSDVSLQFKLPNELVVDVIIKKPDFNLHSYSSNRYVLVDREGVVILEGTNSALPLIELDPDLPKVGQNVNQNILFSSKIMLGVNSMYQVKTGRLVDSGLVVELPNTIRVIFPLQGDADILLGSLRLIYTKIESGGVNGGYTEIDLRFKNPVLR